MRDDARPRVNPWSAFVLVASGTVLGLAGTDLVLPAVPALPAALGGTAAEAQYVLAAFVAGSGVGLIGFGALGARYDPRLLLPLSLAAYGVASIAAGLAPSLGTLVLIRFVQGAAGSAAAVFAPGVIRASFPQTRAVSALGLLGSIESLVPALAPIAGVWLYAQFGWRASFHLVGVMALALAAAVAVLRRRLPATPRPTHTASYAALLGDTTYLRYALSQAFTLGGLLVLVFGAPAVIVGTMGGSLSDFILMQVVGVSFFIVGANSAGRLVRRFGADRTIIGGTLLSAAGALGILGYALAGGSEPKLLALLFIPMNLGLGFRGPPGFFQAVLAAKGDDTRGAAVVVLAILLTTAAGTAAAAPLIASGLTALSAVAAVISTGAVACLAALGRSRSD